MGMLGLPNFWPTPESAMPNQVTETEGADRRALSPFQTYISDDEIYFPKYYKI